MKIKVNKEKLVMSITIGIACFALMLVMFMQFKMVKQTDITAIETMRESELKLELSSWNEKYKQLYARYEEVVTKMEEYKNESVTDQKTAQLLEAELEQLNELLGKTDVVGQGIVIQLIDNQGKKISEDATVYAISKENLLRVINELFAAGAEAISINGNRVISTSAVYTIGTDILKINNGNKISSPYVINAIGNPDYLKSSVSGKGGIVDELEELGHETSVDIRDEIEIEKYSDDISTKYIK
ncbi:MAG: DUF881 domain-containing protein [Clostridia bacterium]|nr:DUF881 domain-containing protein [Clostridia bacterium]